MTQLLRFTSMAGMLLGVGFAAALVQPEWARDLELEPWTQMVWSNLHACFPNASGQHHHSSPESCALLRRSEAKDHIIAEMLDGRLTLFEAAALFGRLNAEYPAQSTYFPCQCESEEECLCRQVMSWVRPRLPQKGFSPQEAVQVRVNLEEDLRRHKEQHGKVVLPDAYLVSTKYLSVPTPPLP